MQTPLGTARHGIQQNGVLEEFTRADELPNPSYVHVDDAAATDIQMANFTIPHLPFGKADRRTGSMDQSLRKLTREVVKSGLSCEGNRISVGVGVISPSVQNDQ